jgi:hypothetical protein
MIEGQRRFPIVVRSERFRMDRPRPASCHWRARSEAEPPGILREAKSLRSEVISREDD